MLRTSVTFLLIALAALSVADISMTTLEPWSELQRMGMGLLTPHLVHHSELSRALLSTLSFALLGTGVAVFAGTLLSFFFNIAAVRLFCAFIRSIHELFWAFILMPFTGLNALCGILAIAIPYSGIFAKVFAEIAQESDREPLRSLPQTGSRFSKFLYASLPIIYPNVKQYTVYRFECALRSSAILGFIGLPTLGYHLETAFREGMYGEAAALLYIFYLLIASLRIWGRPQVIIVLFLAALMLTPWESSLSFTNIIRVFSYDILPWPMRAEGYYSGTGTVLFDLQGIFKWAGSIFTHQALPGMWNTLVLTQLALVATGIFTLGTFPLASKTFHSKWITLPSHLFFIVLRTTPEFILAYIFLQLFGPSMLPAILALFLHNGAILANLTAGSVDTLHLPFTASTGRVNRYLFEVLPRSYGQFLAFLFYRWEVIFRESAILGILGITTLGHYIDSAIAKDHLDTALFLIIITALLNMLIDSLSQNIRRRLHISTQINSGRTACHSTS